MLSTHIFQSWTNHCTRFGIHMFVLAVRFSRLSLWTRAQLQFQLIQIASDEFLLGLSSASDGNHTGFKWDLITTSYLQNAAESAQIALQVFRVEFTIIDRFTWLRWTSGEPRRDFRWSSKRNLSVPGSASGIRLVPLASDQMGVRWVSDASPMNLRCASDDSFRAQEWVVIAQIIHLTDRL